MKPAILPSLLAAACLASCVQFKARPLDADQTRGEFASRSLLDAGLAAFLTAHKTRPAGDWNLNRLALAAAYFHPDVALARAEAAEAVAAITTAAQRPNPTFIFGPQLASNMVGVTPWFFAQSVSIPIETAGKRGKRTEQAQAAAEAAQWRVAARAWTARSRVRTAMLELHGARENIRLLETEQGLHDEAIRKLSAQKDAGDVSPFELTQARLALNRTRLALQDAQRLAATGEAKLAAAVGVPLSELRGVRLNFADFSRLPAASTSAARRLALTRRADLMALLADYAAAEAALRLEVAKQYPDIRLSPGHDYNQGQNRWQLGLNVEVPLNRNRGPIIQAEAKRHTAETRFLAQQNAIQGELDVALAAYQAGRAKAAIAEQLAKEAATAKNTTQRMVDAGEVSALELTRRRLEASTAGLALMAANLEAQVAAGALEDAMQTPLR